MAFVASVSNAVKCSKIASVFSRQSNVTVKISICRSSAQMSTSTKSPDVEDKPIMKSVFVSQSRDVFTNLALEDWMYRHMDFSNHHVMLLWRNDPCVVIGRHQNPWLETDCDVLKKNGVRLVRRNSGGGTVYHDPGNLNVTFFAPRERYNRRKNLEIIVQTLQRDFNLHPEINKKEDIVVDGNYKISGTASKLGRPNSYHHCTLLVDVDKNMLESSLIKNNKMEILTNATNSVPSPTVNLGDIHSGVCMEKLMSSLGWQFLRVIDQTQEDKGWSQVQKTNGFQLINPSDEWFPGIQKIRDELSSWEWNFGKTPKFEVGRNYDVGLGLDSVMMVRVQVENGRVGAVTMSLPDGVSWGDFTGPSISLVSSVTGSQFSPQIFSVIEDSIKKQRLHFTQSAQIGLRRSARAS